MTEVREYFKKKYDKNGPAYLQGVLRTIDKLPSEEEDDEDNFEDEVVEK